MKNGVNVIGMSAKIRAEETNEDPICPHCEKELRSIKYKPIESMLGVRYLYFCPHCRKSIGISHRKGFWMG